MLQGIGFSTGRKLCHNRDLRPAWGDETLMKFRDKLMVAQGENVKLAKYDPGDTLGFDKNAKTKKVLEKNLKRLGELQYLLYAERKHALLVVLQAMDAGGKDGTIRHVMSGVSPLGCKVTAFKAPTPKELSHDFLWRVHKAVPEKGDIGIFNRSHYEDVLIVRVHKIVPESTWSKRYDEINAFESLLANDRVTILKFFLHISKDEQKKRFEERIADRHKRWKVSPADFREREYWDDYMRAYEDALTRCTTREVPWFVIPANKKWFRNLAVAQIIVETLDGLGMKFPKPEIDVTKIKWK
jgi:PPK2 family polyphosphate:nucleotide phosphotransferase